MLTKKRAVCTKPSARKYICCNWCPVFLTPNLRGQMYLHLHCIFKLSFGRHIVGQNAGNDIKSSSWKRTHSHWSGVEKVAVWCCPHRRLFSVSSHTGRQHGCFLFSFLFILAVIECLVWVQVDWNVVWPESHSLHTGKMHSFKRKLKCKCVFSLKAAKEKLLIYFSCHGKRWIWVPFGLENLLKPWSSSSQF